MLVCGVVCVSLCSAQQIISMPVAWSVLVRCLWRTRMTERLPLVLATKPTVFVCNLVQYSYYIAHVVSKQSFVARCCCCGCWGRQSYANQQHHKLLTTRLPVSILLCSANARACAQRNYNRELWTANNICIRLWSGSLPHFAAGWWHGWVAVQIVGLYD